MIPGSIQEQVLKPALFPADENSRVLFSRVLFALLLWLICTPLLHASYDATPGRWASRDPIEEDGGNHLYHFIFNNAIYGFDYLGACPTECCCAEKLTIDPAAPTMVFDDKGPGVGKSLYSKFKVTLPTSKAYKTKVSSKSPDCFYTWIESVSSGSDYGVGQHTPNQVDPGQRKLIFSGSIAPGGDWSYEDTPGQAAQYRPWSGGFKLGPLTPTHGKRKLTIEISLYSARDCKCSEAVTRMSIVQEVKFDHGVPDMSGSSIKVF